MTIADILEDNDVVERATNFIVNGEGGPLNDVDDVLFLTHLASATDVDWFRIPVAQGEQLSVYLANLPADYDVLLYGPAQAPLRGTPSRVLPPSPDGGLSLIGAENATNALVAADIVTTPPNDDWELYAVSSRRGTTSERIDTGALPAGDYAVKVVGYNGATSASPYSLRARTKPAAGAGACAAIPAAAPTTLTLPAAATTVTDETTTILLTHLGRLQRSYPAGGATVRDALVEFASGTSGAPADFADTSAAVVDARRPRQLRRMGCRARATPTRPTPSSPRSGRASTPSASPTRTSPTSSSSAPTTRSRSPGSRTRCRRTTSRSTPARSTAPRR